MPEYDEYGFYLDDNGNLRHDESRESEAVKEETEREFALYDALATIASTRQSLYRHILWIEKFIPDSALFVGDIDCLKHDHDCIREAEELLCKGLGLKCERLTAGTEFDTPRMLPDDHWFNTKEDIAI